MTVQGKALRVTAPKQLEVCNVPRTVPGPGEVEIRVVAGGICGTDVHVFAGHMPPLPRIPGHDVAGEISRVGAGVSAHRRGERVTVDPAACCVRSSASEPHLCPRCAEGRTHLCRDGSYLGIQEDGAFRSHLKVPASRAVPLPDEFTWASATALEPVVVALHLQERIADRPGPALVVGGGPIGLVAASVLSRDRRVVLVEPRRDRQEFAASWDLDVCSPLDLRGTQDFRVLIEASGHPSATEVLLRNAPKGATVVLIGGATDLPGREILTRELEIRAIKGGRGLYPEAIRYVKDHSLPLDALNSHHVTAAEAPAIFEALSSGRAAADNRDILRAVVDLTKL